MEIFNRLPYISLLIHERAWLDNCKVEYSESLDEYDRKYLYKDQISTHNMGNRDKPPNSIGEVAENDIEKNTNDTSLTKLIELDNECYEYDPEILESPLSPDGESLGRNSKIGLDIWSWSRDSTPLGYSPPLCTCKNINMLYENLMSIQEGNLRVIEQHKVCSDENCSGLLYIPYSLIEVPLNRKIDNAMSFTNYVNIPDYTDIYCGNLKHTLVLCTIDLNHEVLCLDAIRDAGLEHHLVYDVLNVDSIVPFFSPIIQQNDIQIEKDAGESKALTLLLDESDDSHSQTAISGQFLVTINKLENNKLAISKVLKNQYGEFKPLDQYFFDGVKKTAGDCVKNEDIQNNINYSEFKILQTTSIKCNMLDCFSKDRRPLNLQLRYNNTSTFDTIENIIGLSLNDLPSDKPIKIDNDTKHHVIANLYKLGLSEQLNNEI